MSVSYAEKEREFITTLEADTGRDLMGWLAAIDAEGLPHRNDIIDWLRHQGFHFGWASWLERIHHNGGRLVYADMEPRDFGTFPKRPRSPSRETAEPRKPSAPLILTLVPPAPRPTAPNYRAPETLPVPNATSSQDVEQLLAKAKAYRPLAKFVLAGITERVPDARLRANANHVSLTTAAGVEFTVLAISAKELRLGIALGEGQLAGALVKAKFSSSGLSIGAQITHMVILTDARQVTGEILASVQAAFKSARG